MDENSPKKDDGQNENGIAGKPLYPTLDAQGHAYEAYEANNATPTPPQKINIQDDIDALHTENTIPNLRTYESDIADVLKSKGGGASVVKIAVSEQKKEEAKKVETQKQKEVQPEIQEIKKEAPKIKPEKVAPEIKKVVTHAEVMPHEAPKTLEATKIPKKKTPLVSSAVVRGIFTTAISIILIGGGLTALTLIVIHLMQNKPAPVAIPKVATIINTESSVDVLLPPNETISHVLAVQPPHLSGSSGSLVQIILHDGTSTSAQLLTPEIFSLRLPSDMPSWLARSLSPTFMLGYQLLDTPQPFIIFKTNEYDNAFAGMLNWEGTLRNDMQGLLLAIPQTSTSTATTSATIATTTTRTAVSTGFVDSVIKNKDVRVLNDTSGKPLIIYSLPDKNTIVITTNPTTLQEIFLRMTTSQFVQ